MVNKEGLKVRLCPHYTKAAVLHLQVEESKRLKLAVQLTTPHCPSNKSKEQVAKGRSDQLARSLLSGQKSR